MKKTLALTLGLSLTLFGMELRVGTGSFDMKFALQNIIQGDFSLDVKRVGLAEPHANIFDSNLYYAFDLQLYKSQKLDRLTTFFAQPLTYQWPYFGSISQAVNDYTPLTAPVDYKIRGIDLDLQIGYDLIKNGEATFGIGLNTGMSMPYMKMYNLKKALQLTLDILDTTKTSVKTYKLGIGYYASYHLNPQASIFSKGSINTQTGSIKNDLIRSSFDVDGNYYDFEIALRYDFANRLKDLYLVAGYDYKKWEIDDTRVQLLQRFSFDFSPLYSLDMEMENFYIGIGYQF